METLYIYIIYEKIVLILMPNYREQLKCLELSFRIILGSLDTVNKVPKPTGKLYVPFQGEALFIH